MPLSQDIHFFFLLLLALLTRALPTKRLIPAPSINAKNTTNIISVPRHRELTISIAPLIQEIADSFADFVLAVLAVVAGAGDSVDGASFAAVFEEDAFEILDSFFRVEAVEIDVEFGALGVVFVALFVELAGGFAVGFSH